MENYKNNLIKKLVYPLFIFLALVCSISVGVLFYLEHAHIYTISSDKFHKTSKLFDKKFNEDIKNYKSFIKLISKDTKAIELFTSNNRTDLYHYYKNLYNDFKKDHNLSHFYFHTKDKVNFLRVHNNKNHSDLIDRYTLNDAAISKDFSAGIEFGIFHNLTLRVVSPWFVNNKVIGYIELGKEIDYFTPELVSLGDTEIVFTINKNYISQKDYQQWIEKSKSNISFKELKDYYIIDSSLDKYSFEIKKVLNSQHNIENIEIDNFIEHYHAFSRPFLDIYGKEIGKMYVLANMSSESDFLNALVFKVTLIMFFLLSILIVYYRNLVKKEAYAIDKNHDTMRTQTITDSLTSLYNKRYFDYRLPLSVQSAKQNNHYISCIMADIDSFKLYNDHYGHSKGDEILKKVGFKIQDTFKRSDDRCFRVGGEEFAIIIESEEEDIAFKMAEQMRQNIQNLNIEHHYNENFNTITLSLGVVTIKAKDLKNEQQLYIDSDKLLYEAKRSGKNQVKSNL